MLKYLLPYSCVILFSFLWLLKNGEADKALVFSSMIVPAYIFSLFFREISSVIPEEGFLSILGRFSILFLYYTTVGLGINIVFGENFPLFWGCVGLYIIADIATSVKKVKDAERND